MFVSNEARKPTPLADADGVEKLSRNDDKQNSDGDQNSFLQFLPSALDYQR